MRIFMAGGVSGNLKPFFKSFIEIYNKTKDINSAERKAMKIFMAGLGGRYWIPQKMKEEAENASFFGRGRPVEKRGDLRPDNSPT